MRYIVGFTFPAMVECADPLPRITMEHTSDSLVPTDKYHISTKQRGNLEGYIVFYRNGKMLDEPDVGKTVTINPSS